MWLLIQKAQKETWVDIENNANNEEKRYESLLNHDGRDQLIYEL